MSSSESSNPTVRAKGSAHAPDLGPRFVLETRLGSGAYGTVYSARDLATDTRVALKLLRDPAPESLYRFKREFRILRDLRHPNIVRLGDLFEYQGAWMFTMELISGVGFLEYVRPSRERALDESRLRGALRDVIDGVLAVHAAGLVHRDIKPSNVLVDAQGRAVVLDFGLVADARDGLGPTLSALGTVAYMSPEQASGSPLGPASDWYSVGSMLYEALTRQLPFEGAAIQVMMKKQQGLPPDPRTLGLDVPHDLAELCLQALNPDPKARLTGLAMRAQLCPTRPSNPPSMDPGHGEQAVFVGRQNERLFLSSAFAKAREGRRTFVSVHGESGIGKTALLGQAIAELIGEEPSAVVLEGRCFEHESVPFNGFDSLIDRLAHYLTSLSQEELRRVLPKDGFLLLPTFPVLGRVRLLAQRAPLNAPADDGPTLRARVFTVLRELLLKLSEKRLVVLALDDLQWADADSLALLEALADGREGRLLLAATARPLADCPPRVVSALDTIERRLGQAGRLVLSGLCEDDATTLARTLLGEREATQHSSGEIRALVADAEGHPLFIDTLVKARERFSSAAPRHLEEALGLRFGRLNAAQRALLSLVCVAGARTDALVLTRAARLDPEDSSQALSELTSQKLVRARAVDSALMVEPFHDRVRTIRLASLDADALVRSHLQLAQAMSELGRADPEQLAWNFRQAGRPQEALPFLLEGASRASQALAFERAVRLYEQALETLEAPDSALLARYADALSNSGRGADAARAYVRALERAASEPGANPLTSIDSLELERRAAAHFLRSGLLEEGVAMTRRVIAHGGDALATTPVSALLGLLYERVRLGFGGLTYVKQDPEAVPLETRQRIDALWSLGASLSTMDHVRSTVLLTRALRASLQAGDELRLSRSLATEAISQCALEAPPLSRSQRLLKLSEEIAARSGDPYARGIHALCAAGVSFAGLDRYGEAVASAREAAALFQGCTGAFWERDQARFFELLALAYLGHYRAMRELSDTCQREASARGDVLMQRNLATSVEPFPLIAEDRPHRALAQMEPYCAAEGGEFLLHHMQYVFGRGVVLVYQRDEGALSWFERWKPKIERAMLLRVRLFRVQFLAWHGRALLVAARTERASQQARFDRVAKISRQLRACKTDQARAQALQLDAAVARRQGDLDAAAVSLRKAHAIWAERKSEAYTSALEARLGSLLGGDEGAELNARAAVYFQREQIANPKRFTALYAP